MAGSNHTLDQGVQTASGCRSCLQAFCVQMLGSPNSLSKQSASRTVVTTDTHTHTHTLCVLTSNHNNSQKMRCQLLSVVLSVSLACGFARFQVDKLDSFAMSAGEIRLCQSYRLLNLFVRRQDPAVPLTRSVWQSSSPCQNGAL